MRGRVALSRFRFGRKINRGPRGEVVSQHVAGVTEVRESSATAPLIACCIVSPKLLSPYANQKPNALLGICICEYAAPPTQPDSTCSRLENRLLTRGIYLQSTLPSLSPSTSIRRASSRRLALELFCLIMTTLRSFQEEIDKVRSVEIQKQRAKVAHEREETEKSKVALKSKEAEHKTSNKGDEAVKVASKGKLKSDAKLTTPQAKEMEKPVESDTKEEATSPVEDRRSVVLDTSETEEKIQVCLILSHWSRILIKIYP